LVVQFGEVGVSQHVQQLYIGSYMSYHWISTFM